MTVCFGECIGCGEITLPMEGERFESKGPECTLRDSASGESKGASWRDVTGCERALSTFCEGALLKAGRVYRCDCGDTDRVRDDMRRWCVIREARSPFPSSRRVNSSTPPTRAGNGCGTEDGGSPDGLAKYCHEGVGSALDGRARGNCGIARNAGA